ncbi:RxLR effector protein, partial [Phytophthora megakarya]
MRALSVGLIAVMSCALVTADSTKSDVATVQSAVEFIPRVEVAHNQVKRTLRQYIPVD